MKLRTYLYTALTLLLINVKAEAALATVKLNLCSWIGPDSTLYFTNCINTNFTKIKRAAGLDLASCYNAGNALSYSYQICVRKNLRHISERLAVSLEACPTLGEEVNVLYVRCIQQSFKAIERKLN